MDPTNEQSDPIIDTGVLGGIQYDGNGFELLWGWWNLVNMWKITSSEQDPGHEVLAPQLNLDSLSDNHLGSEMIWNDQIWTQSSASLTLPCLSHHSPGPSQMEEFGH